MSKYRSNSNSSSKTDKAYKRWLAKTLFGVDGDRGEVAGTSLSTREHGTTGGDGGGSGEPATGSCTGVISCARSCVFVLNVLMALAPHESIFASKAQRYVLASSVCPAEFKQTDAMQVYFSIVASRERDVVATNLRGASFKSAGAARRDNSNDDDGMEWDVSGIRFFCVHRAIN
jgi:hypothetical protein